MPLKELEARYATRRAKDYKLADGEGLYLLVRANGSKPWRMKYRFADNEKLLCLGRYPDVSLAAARLRRSEAKVALWRGRGPPAAAKWPSRSRPLKLPPANGMPIAVPRSIRGTPRGVSDAPKVA